MKIDNVTSAKKKGDRSIELTISDPLNGTINIKRYSAIRGGISWPTPKSPAYVCILAQEYVVPPVMVDKVPVGSRVLLAEYESDSFSLSSDFYSRITDIAEQMFCHDFYVGMPENRFSCGYLNDFNAFSRERNAKVCLQSAYDVDNFILGVSRLNGSMNEGGLIIPKDSIIFSQLQNLTRPDLENSLEEFFHAINAMRHVVGSFYRIPPIIRYSHNSRLIDRMRRINRPKGFMAA